MSSENYELAIGAMAVTLCNWPGSPMVLQRFGAPFTCRYPNKPKSPSERFLASKYIDSIGRECIPVVAVKRSIVRAAKLVNKLSMIKARNAIFVCPEGHRGESLIPIETGDGRPAIAKMREDWVHLSDGSGIATAAVYRAEYRKWELRIGVEFNTNIISNEMMLRLLVLAGMDIGLGDGRPEFFKACGWGRFKCINEQVVPKLLEMETLDAVLRNRPGSLLVVHNYRLEERGDIICV